MDLTELKLNRFLYRSSGGGDIKEDNPVYMSSQVYSQKEQSAKQLKEQNKKDAQEVITGTVITACLIKSSDQDDRIEIGQNLELALNGVDIGSLRLNGVNSLDYLAAYRPGGKIGFLLTGVGFIYVGYGMPAVKVINLEQGQTQVRQTTTEVVWSLAILGTGRYRITHNLNSIQYAVSVIPTNSGASDEAYANVSNKGLNSFVVEIFTPANLGGGNLIDSDFDCIIQVFNQ